ncbi:glycosyl transferase, group 2 family protein [mine drainage metagenome]|uniref:Glycosyl transferase, group 2 family protein n=1 Tax=mine drainage metagenome TaxID=410659 RepID=T1B916_9ZZZZ
MAIWIDGVVAAYNTVWAGINAYNFSALLRRERPSETDPENLNLIRRDASALPKISILLPAYHEANVLRKSVGALYNSDYPREKFEILLLLEHDDPNTINTAAQLSMEYSNVRTILVSSKHYKNKPNALNHGLFLSTGNIIGVIDAEDIVEKELLLKVAYNIDQRKYDIVQGVLDMTNDSDGWKNLMQRAEYAYWFKYTLPGLEASGLPVPLGGTTNFFRRNILESLNGWNPNNLTEDFELGIRLYNHNISASKYKKSLPKKPNDVPLYPYINKYTADFYAQHASDYSSETLEDVLNKIKQLEIKVGGNIKRRRCSKE